MDRLATILLWLLGILFVLAILVMVFAPLGPSCEERGGREVFSHFLPIFTGKTVVMAPQYVCELPEKDK